MIIKNRTTFYMLAMSCILFFSQCSKQLDDISPKDQIPEDQLSNNDMVSLKNGMYSQMENVMFAYAFDFDVRAGHYIGGPGFSLSGDPINMGPTDPTITTMWQTSFAALDKINYLLETIDKKSNPAAFNTIKGEALYFRALNYTQMVYRWGGVPILTKRTSAKVQRATEAEVWAQIKTDLLAAEKLLPDYSDRFYISAQAVQALLAKVYLSSGDKANAIVFADKVLSFGQTSGKLALANSATDYASMLISGSTSKELIFAFANNTTSNPHLYYQQLNDIDGSWSYSPTVEVYNNLYSDPAIASGDKRKSAVFSNDKTRVIKFPNGVSGQQLVSTINANFTPILVSRVAELYLIKAEAQGLGQAAETTLQPYFNARYQTVPAAGTVAALSALNFQNLILDENRREFFGEGHRWYDLKRTNRTDLLTSLNGRTYLMYYPIPQTEKDLAGYTQNPGYN